VGQRLSGGITAPGGFRAAGVACGLKRRKPSAAEAPLDLALVSTIDDVPVPAAAVFTTNLAVAAPIVVSREHLAASMGLARAVVINSGCANACTGTAGMQAARDMAGATRS
jgi:glutamate N-acetyltransferase / amino-acid N-acetyltransferase